MVRTSSARERMVRTTKDLLCRQGYNGTGLNQIIDESQAPKGSLYHFFPGGKEHLAGEAVRLGAAEVEQFMYETILAAPTVNEGLARVVERVIQHLEDSDYHWGCPISTVALETVGTPGPLQDTCSAAFRSIEKVIADAFEREGRTPDEAASMANLVLCAFEGGLLLSRTHHCTRPLLDMVRTMSALSTR